MFKTFESFLCSYQGSLTTPPCNQIIEVRLSYWHHHHNLQHHHHFHHNHHHHHFHHNHYHHHPHYHHFSGSWWESLWRLVEIKSTASGVWKIEAVNLWVRNFSDAYYRQNVAKVPIKKNGTVFTCTHQQRQTLWMLIIFMVTLNIALEIQMQIQYDKLFNFSGQFPTSAGVEI